MEFIGGDLEFIGLNWNGFEVVVVIVIKKNINRQVKKSHKHKTLSFVQHDIDKTTHMGALSNEKNKISTFHMQSNRRVFLNWRETQGKRDSVCA